MRRIQGQRSMPPGRQGAERQSEGSSTCTRAFQRNFLVGDIQVSTIISRRTESQILKNSWISESVTPLVPTSCRKLTENCTSRFQTKPRHQEKGDVVGRLIRSMSGFGGCKQYWMRDWRSLLQPEGYAARKANLALFFNRQRSSRGCSS